LASWSSTVRRDARIVLPSFVVSRLIVIVATIAGSRLIPAGASTTFPTHGPAALQPFFRFDATYYQSLWQSGYSGQLAAYHAAFYPLYPLLVRAIGTLPVGPELAALLISNLAFLAALFLIYRIAIRYLEPAVASRSLWILALWPWAIFYSYAYAESVELVIVAAAFLLMERGAWIWSGLVAGIAGASRPSGILTSLAFAGEFIQRVFDFPSPLGEGRVGATSNVPPPRGEDRVGAVRVRDRDSLTRVVIGGLLSPLGLVAFCLILLAQRGNPFAFLHAQSLWLGPQPRNPLFPITSALRLFTRHDILDTEAPVFPILVGFVAAIAWSVRRLPLRYAAWGAGFLLVAVLQGYYVRSVTAAPRHVLEWFPLFFAVASLLRPSRAWFLTPLWLVASAVVLAAYAAMFGSWHYVS
jgi:hypothetical protein